MPKQAAQIDSPYRRQYARTLLSVFGHFSGASKNRPGGQLIVWQYIIFYGKNIALILIETAPCIPGQHPVSTKGGDASANQ